MSKCPSYAELNRDCSRPQRPTRRRYEFIPVGLLVIIRVLAHRANGERTLITFGPETKHLPHEH